MRAHDNFRQRNLPDAIGHELRCNDVRGRAVRIGVAGLALLPALQVNAATYVVDTTGDPGPALSTSLRQAIVQANAGPNNFVEFAPSLNGSTITLAQGEIAINQPMYLVGPGADKLTISGNDASRIFDISTVSSTPIGVTLAGLRLTHGHVGSGLGGAIATSNVSLTVLDSVFDYNYARNGGGAIYLRSGSGVASESKLTRTMLAHNSADTVVGRGGGIAAARGDTLQIIDSAISANTASDSAGGFFYDVASTTINDCLITGNSATLGTSGGLNLFHDAFSGVTSDVAINTSTISANSSTIHGGGLTLINVVATLTGDTISSNSTGYEGGGIFVFDSTTPTATQLNLFQSTVSGNTADSFGGGIAVAGAASVTISHSLIAFNGVYSPSIGTGGGGLALEYAKTSSSIDNSTFYGNYAYNNGGGIGIFDAATGNSTTISGTTIAGNLTFNYSGNGILGAGTPQIYGCIIANNSSHAGTVDVDGSFQESYSLIRNTGTATVTIGPAHNKNGQDPLLGPLAVNGGPTLTILPALASPALDAGGSSSSGTDQRGLPRNVNGHRDMGSVERQYPEDVIFRDGFGST